jgi:hypothetical protein
MRRSARNNKKESERKKIDESEGKRYRMKERHPL